MTMKKAPGKSHRKGLTFLQVAGMFRDEKKARDWVAKHRWPNGPACPRCGSINVQSNIKHKTMTHRCRDCSDRSMFSVKTGTVMEGSNLPYRVWAVGIYLFTTNIKGISSMRLHRELGISQKAAWFMLARLRKAYEVEVGPFAGPIEVDETYIGGKRRNMPKSKREKLDGRGVSGKTAVVGVKDRKSNQVAAKVVEYTDKPTLQEFVARHAEQDTVVYTDEAKAYEGLPFPHESVKHSVGEYVNNQAHVNGVESFWSLLKRGYYGTYHKMSPKHLDRYVKEFSGRHNARGQDTIDQMRGVVRGMDHKRIRYKDLIADNGLDSTARS